MRITDILASKGSDVITIAPEASVHDLIALLKKHNLGAVVVSPDSIRLIGIVSERDVIRRLADDSEFLTGPVSAIMTSDVHTCEAGESVDSLMTLMTNERIRHVPVVAANGSLTGLVSIGDVVKNQISELLFERDQLEGYVHSAGHVS